MPKIVDDFLNGTTMYRLVLYYLALLVVAGLVLSTLGVLSFSPLWLLFSVLFLVSVCWVTNKLFGIVFGSTTNLESVYITALILCLVVSPAKSLSDFAYLFWVGVWAMASKYIVSLNRKHLFNPVAFALVLMSVAGVGIASWWIGTLAMLPFVLLGVLIVRKVDRFDMVFYFLTVAMMTILFFGFLGGKDILATLEKSLFYSPLLFFAFVMITEPVTTPPRKFWQSIYGGIVGFLFSPQVHFGTFYATPEMALAAGNIFSWAVSPKFKLLLHLKEKVRLAPDIYDFIFSPDRRFVFLPGQYLEWTLAQRSPDSRGSRRFFTLASSPTEDGVRIGVKFSKDSSSFKKELLNMPPGGSITGSQLSGDFVLPEPGKKLVFIAGGIGITPFRSMIKYLLDKKEKRPIVLFYSNRAVSDIVYNDLFARAVDELGIKVVYVLTSGEVPTGWVGKTGYIDEKMIREEAPDFRERMFYISGPPSMVSSYRVLLEKMGVPGKEIVTDYFPGFS